MGVPTSLKTLNALRINTTHSPRQSESTENSPPQSIRNKQAARPGQTQARAVTVLGPRSANTTPPYHQERRPKPHAPGYQNDGLITDHEPVSAHDQAWQVHHSGVRISSTSACKAGITLAKALITSG